MKKQPQPSSLFERPFARGAAIVVVIGVLVMAAWTLWNTFAPNSSITAAETMTFVDAENGKAFTVKIEPGMQIPVKSPFTGNMTGYKAELCYWTKDGTPKTDPTAVLMNSDIGKPGPTFCPDCGRLVVFHNPEPRPGMRPPPTEAQYWATHNRSAYGN